MSYGINSQAWYSASYWAVTTCVHIQWPVPIQLHFIVVANYGLPFLSAKEGHCNIHLYVITSCVKIL